MPLNFNRPGIYRYNYDDYRIPKITYSELVMPDKPFKFVVLAAAVALIMVSYGLLIWQNKANAPARQALSPPGEPADVNRRCDNCGGFLCSMPGAPIESERLSFEEICRSQLSQDGQHIYSYDVRLEGADPVTFEALSGWYYKDRHAVWYVRRVITEADAATFDVISPGDTYSVFARDKNHVYKSGEVLAGIDPETFELVTSSIWKDRRAVYYDSSQNVIAGVDPATFEVVGRNYGKDKNSVFYLQHPFKKLPNAEPASFRVVDDKYAKDKRQVYYYANLLAGAQAASFQVFKLSGCTASYGKDINRVYYEDGVIPGANPGTFAGSGGCYASDSSRYYFHQYAVEANHRERCDFDDPQFSKANILPLYPLPDSQIEEKRPTIMAKIVDYSEMLIEGEMKQLKSPYSGELQTYLEFIPGRMQRAEFYFDGQPVTEVYGAAQYPSVNCELPDTGTSNQTLNTAEECLQKKLGDFPPILFFYRPSQALAEGRHTFKIKLAGEEAETAFYVSRNPPAQAVDVCPALPELDRYDARTFCDGGYYHTGNPLHVPIPRYKSERIFYTPSVPQSLDGVEKYQAQNLVMVRIKNKYFDLKLPASTYFFSAKESDGQGSIPEQKGVYLPREILYFSNGARVKELVDYDWHYLDLVPIDSAGRVYEDRVKTHRGVNSSACDG